MTHKALRTTVGFVGLGQMGKPMALNLTRADIDLIVTAKTSKAFGELQQRGARTTLVFDDFRDARIVFLSLPGTEAVRSVLFAPGALASKLAAGAIIVDTSTMAHASAVQIHEALITRGIAFLDAPVSGMQARAESGTLTIMCGGGREAFEAVRPLLGLLGNNILHTGGAGSGQLTKLINQLLFDIHCAALAEILPMASRMGLDPEKTASVINSGTGRSYASEFFLPRILRNRFSDGYPLEAGYKDLISAAELGVRHCVPMPVLAAAIATYQTALLHGHGNSDKGALVRVYEDLLHVRFRAASDTCEDGAKNG